MSNERLRKAIEDARLYVLLTTDLCKLPVIETARLAISGGADVIQLRDKCAAEKALFGLARELRELTGERNVLFIINDRPDVAAEVEADGVHIGQEDMSVQEARRLAGGNRLVGVSAHSVLQARRAEAAGADYLGVGPIFTTGTKAHVKPVGTQLIRDVINKVSIPFFAIGGINTHNIRPVLEAGATRVAVCSAIISQEDVTASAGGFSRILRHTDPAK